MKVLLQAPPGTGKSTIIAAVVRKYPGATRGIVAREILDENGERTGFTSVNQVGVSRQFMFRTDTPGLVNVDGQFDVDIEAIDSFVVPEVRKALAEHDSLVYIDEIGRAQAKSKVFVKLIQEVFRSPQRLLASIVYEDEPWSLEFKHAPGVRLISVTTDNRDALPDELLAMLCGSEKV